MSNEPVMELQNLSKHFDQSTSLLASVLPWREAGVIRAVDDVSLTIHKNDSVAIIGESGCGKSTLLMTLMGLYEPTSGDITFRGKAFSDFSRKDWKQFRSNVQIIFQNPFDSLNPKMTVREAVREPLDIHGFDNKDGRVREILKQVELSPPEKYLDQLPRELSGGEKQRVSIARALVLEPAVVLADEPVSMLDVSTQASVLKLLSRLTDELDVALVYVSHDLSTVSYVCDFINVMYLGRVVESAPTKPLLNDPKHPYAEALINAVPIPDPHHKRTRAKLEGKASAPGELNKGCRFRNRCPERMDICEQKPEFAEVNSNRHVACHLHYDHESAGQNVMNTKTTKPNRQSQWDSDSGMAESMEES